MLRRCPNATPFKPPEQPRLPYNHHFRLTKDKGDKAKILSAGVSAFNVLNHTNFTSYIRTLSSSRFGQPTAALAGRQFQFSVGFQF